MAAVYKTLSKTNGHQEDDNETSNSLKKTKQKVLILSSRGVTYRQRHLLNDLASLLPHSRKDAKLDTKSKLYQLNELAELYNCNNVFFFEARKGKDLYLWMSKAPNGPTAKMHLQNLHTVAELHFTGNCLRGSRPILSFSSHFNTTPHLLLVKELFLHIFGVPKGARKTKPFVDHIMGFTLADGKIWVRNYQIVESPSSTITVPSTSSSVSKPEENKAKDKKAKKEKKTEAEEEIKLIEIGPRFVLTPIVIQEGSFGGPIIYENKEFVSPNQVRSEVRRRKAGRYGERMEKERERGVKKGGLGLSTEDGGERVRDELDGGVLFA